MAEDQTPEGRRLVITGGTGFIGSRLALTGIDRGMTVRVLGQTNTEAESGNRERLEAAGVTVHLGSVTDRETVRALVAETDIVVHLAAAQHEMSISDQRFGEVNVAGTRVVLEECAAAGVGRVVHGSTIGVYGITTGVVDESTPCNPHNIYGKTKLEGERLAAAATDVPVVVVRIPEIYGPGDRRLLKLFRALRKGRFFLIGPGRNLHDVLYVDDLVDGLLVAAGCDAAIGKVLQFGGPAPLTTDEMIAAVARAVGVDPPRLRVPLWPLLTIGTLMEFTLRPMGIQPPLHRRRLDFFRNSFELSSTRARELIGFNPRVTFADGARATAEWYRAEGLLQ
ncbi:MAG: NAD-dependent epimerase/dehydratase family protein [Gemmatimonadota bacterium]